MREIPNVWIAAVGLLALFTAVESYFVLTRILIDMRRLFSLQRQKIYLAVLVNIAIFLLLNGGIMLYFANQKGAVIRAVVFIGFCAGLGLLLGTVKILRQNEP